MPATALTFPYAAVEAALVQAYGIGREDVGAFRGRLAAFQKGNLLGARPGKGTALQYSPDMLHRLVLAAELAEAGVTPGVILRLVADFWESRLRAIFTEAERVVVHPTPGGDVVLLLAGISLVSGGAFAVPNVNHCSLRKLSTRLEFAMRDDVLPARALVVNLTARLRRFHTALADVHLLPDRPVETLKRAKKVEAVRIAMARPGRRLRSKRP
jgi:hypothetical protein